MRKFITFGLLLSLAACSPPHRFEVSADRPIAKADIKLQHVGQSMTVTGYTAKAVFRDTDDDGTLQIVLIDGDRVECRVGYITPGEQEPHRYEVKDGQCRMLI